jgi:DNA ligase (NAD+)
MSELSVRIENMLGFIDLNGEEGFDDSKVEELERIILDCNSLMTGSATNHVADSIYDALYDMLKRVKPSSKILSEIWEEEGDVTEYTELLRQHPMMSIETAKSYNCKALTDFINRMPEGSESYFASYKINGHGIRVVYRNGHLVSATSRARSSAGRDLTRQMKILLGTYNAQLADYEMVELRGELCLPISKLEEARRFNPAIKSAFSAVSSLIRPSTTAEEVRLLDFLCYGFIVDGVSFMEREEEFQEIVNCGFNTPEYMLIEEATRSSLPSLIKDVVAAFEEGYEAFGYFCDGVVFECNNRELFEALGSEGNHNLGNVALKVGVWEQVSYVGYVQEVQWKRGKSKLSPVAIVAESPGILQKDYTGKILNMDELGVLTAQGNKVRNVPLYEPKNILILGAYPGEPLNFRYGGEAGVVPCFPDGRLLKEDAAKEVLTGEYDYE